jgi:hypothetical protein
MSRKRGLTIIALLAIATAFSGCRHKASSMAAGRSTQNNEYAAMLAKNVMKPDREQYYPVGQRWQNPTVFVDIDGIFITLADQAQRRAVKIGELAKELAQLPRSAWPLGRVAVFAQSARIPISLEGIKLSQQEKQAYNVAREAIEILKALDLEIVYAPVN